MKRIATILIAALSSGALARDNGQYANSDPKLKEWFNHLQSQKGPCCSDADGNVVSDSDWVATKDGHYRVLLGNKWIDVEDSAVITEPNKYGRTMVWPFYSNNGADTQITIRCFMPGSMT